MRKTIIASAMICTLALATSAFAQSANDESIKSDVNSLNKDNSNIQQDQSAISQNRAAAARDKANGNYGSEAVDNVKSAGNQVTQSAHSAKKSVDKKMLKHHKKAAKTDTGDAGASTTDSSGNKQ